MRTIATIATIAACASAWDAEFLRGAQTGMFLTSEDQFEDYSCPTAPRNPQLANMIEMAKPMKMMMKNMK